MTVVRPPYDTTSGLATFTCLRAKQLSVQLNPFVFIGLYSKAHVDCLVSGWPVQLTSAVSFQSKTECHALDMRGILGLDRLGT